MIFAELPPEQCEGALLVHAIKLGAETFKKGRKLSATDIAKFRQAGRQRVTVAKLEPGEIGEDEAAAAIAGAIAGQGIRAVAPFTGRANLFATAAGLVTLDRGLIDRLNAIDEAVTIATLPAYAPVAPEAMIATVKIIPFAVSGEILRRCLDLLAQPALAVAPFRARKSALIQTRLPGLKPSILDKTAQVMSARLAAIGLPAPQERRCAHEVAALCAAILAERAMGAELVMIAGASAITDRRDVLPSAIEAAGGKIIHFGMPVDPGNLLLLAEIDGQQLLGLPGCARSPKLNGFDWVLQRLAADLPVGKADITAMGVGGLLMEIPTRPQPRLDSPNIASDRQRAPRIAALILAAGRSSRMGGANKLLAEIAGKPMIRHAVEAALAAKLSPIHVVTGNDAERVEAALAGCPVVFRRNPNAAEGLSSSLACGLRSLPATAIDGAMVMLGDMPRVDAEALRRLVAAFNPLEGRAICLPTFDGKRGNPVLWAVKFFDEMMALAGDVGARALIGAYGEQLVEVAMPDDGTLIDVDTPQALDALRREQERSA